MYEIRGKCVGFEKMTSIIKKGIAITARYRNKTLPKLIKNRCTSSPSHWVIKSFTSFTASLFPNPCSLLYAGKGI